MSETLVAPSTETTDSYGNWDAFWFMPGSIASISATRGLLCLLAAVYFASCWSDASFWYADGGPLSPSRVSTYLQTAGVESEARWIVSPLFLTEAAWVYRGYLAVAIVIAVLVAAGRGGRAACWSLWLLLVVWANRAMILSGLTETLLSLGLFAAAIAPPCPSWKALGPSWKTLGPSWQALGGKSPGSEERHWTAGFAQRLMAVQITLVGAATFVTMLGGRVWFNGLGAYALAAPLENRTIDWTAAEGFLVNPLVHEPLTHAMVVALPLGFLLAWMKKTNRIGQAILVMWCLVVALLGSHWLYAAVFATMVGAIRPIDRRS